jgi:protein SCO1/2
MVHTRLRAVRCVVALWDTFTMTSSSKSWWPFVALAVVGALAGAWFARSVGAPPAPAPVLQTGTWLPEPRAVEFPALIDSSGTPFDTTRLAGGASVAFFGFTHCPDVCPTTLAQLAAIKRDGHLAGLRVLLVTVDPERDTPQVLRTYLAAFDPEFIGLTGEVQNLAALRESIGVAAARVDLPGGVYTMDHTAALFVLDGAGRLRAVFTPPLAPATLGADLDAAGAAAAAG